MPTSQETRNRLLEILEQGGRLMAPNIMPQFATAYLGGEVALNYLRMSVIRALEQQDVVCGWVGTSDTGSPMAIWVARTPDCQSRTPRCIRHSVKDNDD